MNAKTKQITTAVVAAGIGVGVLFVLGRYKKNIWQKLNRLISKDPLKNQKIHIVNNVDECRIVVEKLRK